MTKIEKNDRNENRNMDHTKNECFTAHVEVVHWLIHIDQIYIFFTEKKQLLVVCNLCVDSYHRLE